MLNFNNTQRVSIWKIEMKENYALVRMGSSRQDKASGEYKNSTWSFYRFVGEAFKKIDQLNEKDRIVLKGAGISLEPYVDKNGETQYPKIPQIVVFNWEPFVPDGNNSTSGDSAPVVASSDDEDLPF